MKDYWYQALREWGRSSRLILSLLTGETNVKNNLQTESKRVFLTCRLDSRHLLAAVGSWMFKATVLASWTIEGIAAINKTDTSVMSKWLLPTIQLTSLQLISRSVYIWNKVIVFWVFSFLFSDTQNSIGNSGNIWGIFYHALWLAAGNGILAQSGVL